MDGEDSQRSPWARTLSRVCFRCAHSPEGETEVWRDEAICSRLYSLEQAWPGFEHSSACSQSKCFRPPTPAPTPSKLLVQVQWSSTSPGCSWLTLTLTGNPAPHLPEKTLKLRRRSPPSPRRRLEPRWGSRGSRLMPFSARSTCLEKIWGMESRKRSGSCESGRWGGMGSGPSAGSATPGQVVWEPRRPSGTGRAFI